MMKKNWDSVPQKVSFIIVNYNSSDLTEQCVMSIQQHIKMEYEIIVVDNASSKKDYDNLRLRMPSFVQIIRSKLNSGMGGGNLLGANFANGDYFCFINSDVIFTEDCVSPLCSYLEENPHVGCITPQQYSPDGRKISSFGHNNGLRFEIFKDRIFEILFPKRFPTRNIQTEPIIVNQINGCFMFLPAPAFWQAGGFDTNIFLYCEEYDLATRLRRIGLQSVVHPCYRYTHLGSSSTKKLSKSIVRREDYISRLYVYRKHHGLLISLLYQLVLIVKVLVNPHKWNMLDVVFRGEALSISMKHQLKGVS